MNATKGFLFLMITLACKGEPVRSYCEALCDWAVSCTAEVRDIDVQAETDACLEATRGVDPSCAKAEDGTIDPASKAALEPCVNAIDDAAAAGECDGFTGSIDELKTATVPASCATQGDDAVATFDDVRLSTQETGEELCGRFTETICQKATDCLLGDFELPQEAIDAVGGTPYEICVQRFDPLLTAECIAADRYKAEENLDDVNAARQSARECLVAFEDVECNQLLATPPQLPPICAGSFTSNEQLESIVTALAGVYGDFEEYIPVP